MRRILLAAALAPAALAAQSAIPGMSQSQSLNRAAEARGAVEYLFPEQITLTAAKPATVRLHFRVAPGLHINSHTPKDSGLIPTALAFPPESGVKLESAQYPKGETYALPADPKTRLDVYTGEFTIEALVLAAPGDHLVEARLRYQACDNSACMPPKTLTVAIDVLAR